MELFPVARATTETDGCEVSVILPCLNEAETVGASVTKAVKTLRRLGLRSGMGSLDAVRPAIQASTLIILGAQAMFSSFFLGMLAVPRRGEPVRSC